MKNKIKKILAAVLTAVLIVCLIPVSVFASGSFYISATTLVLTVGYTGGVSFGADDAVGFFTIDTDGGVSASCSDELYVDDSSVYITVTAESAGTGHVYITVYDGTDYDGNDLSGKSYTVTVIVKEDSTTAATTAQTTETTTTKSTTQTTTTKSTTQSTTTKSTTTTAETTTEADDDDDDDEDTDETEELTEEELLTVIINNASYTVLKDISDITLPSGFTVEETEYNTVTVETMVLDDYVIYVLEGNVTGRTAYYFLDDETGEFEKVKYTTVDEDICIFLDMPDDLEVPYGYSLVETDMFGYTVEALALDEEAISEALEAEEELSAEEAASESAIEIKSFDTVGAPVGTLYDDNEETSAADDEDVETEGYTDPILGDVSVTTADVLADSAGGHYFVYCLWDGEEVLCDYDSEEDSISKCTVLLVIEEPEEETDIPDETDEEESSGSFSVSLFWIVLIALLVVIAAVVIILSIMMLKRKKYSGAELPYEYDDEDENETEDVLLEKQNSNPSGNADDNKEYEELLRKNAEKLRAKYSKDAFAGNSGTETGSAGTREAEYKEQTNENIAFAKADQGFTEVKEAAEEDSSGKEAVRKNTRGENDRPVKDETDAKPSKKTFDPEEIDTLFEEEELDVSAAENRSIRRRYARSGVEDITAILTEEFDDLLRELKENEEE